MRCIKYLVVLLASALASLSTADAADNFPSSPVNLIVAGSPGQTIDIIARLYADKVAKALNQSVVVINKPGAGGLLAAQAVATAAPDGYTVLVANSGHSILGVMNKNLPFDPVKDFAGISTVADAPALVVVSPTLHVKTLAEFVAYAKAHPKAVNFGSAGIGSSTHLSGAYFAYKAGIDLVHVPYKNSAEILTDLVSDRIQVTFSPFAFILPMLASGKLIPLAVGAPEGMTKPYVIPSTHASGIDYDYSTWYGFLSSAKVPADRRKVFEDAITKASKDPELNDKIVAQGLSTHVMQGAEFDTYIRNEMSRLAPVLTELSKQLGG